MSNKVKQKVDTATNPDFGTRLAEAFNNAGTAEIARKLGLKYHATRNYLKGRVPGTEILLKISLLTHCSIHWLVTGKGGKFANPYDEYFQLEQLDEQARIGETSAGYNATESETVTVHFGKVEHRIISAMAAKFGRTIEDQIIELVLENLIERLKEGK